jgi:hypothetical protein
MGLRGPGARSLSRSHAYSDDPPGPNTRRLKLLQRLQVLAHGTGLRVELAGAGQVTVAGAPIRIEELLVRERAQIRSEK